MMDPFSALSFASSIAQLLTLVVSVSKAVNEIAATGKTSDVAHLGSVVEDFAKANSRLRRQLTSGSLSPEQEALSDLCDQCTEVAQELSNCLKRVCGTGPKTSTLSSLRAAFRTIWIKDEIDRLARRLAEYRSELTLRVLLLINSHVQDQQDDFTTFREEITEVLSLNAEAIQSSLDDHYSKTVAAILTTKSGQSTAIIDLHAEKGVDVKFDTATTIYSAYGETYEGDGLANSRSTLRVRSNVPDCYRKISDALHFREISQRHSTISKAHEKTFQWIWKSADPGSTDHTVTSGSRLPKWDNLSNWLRRGQGCYWVSGKAGSGKSSLMKYIQSHDNTTKLLQDWARNSSLVIGSFYFWYAGSELQRSQEGLIRSLLLCVLQKFPSLTLLLFPDLCRAILSGNIKGKLVISSIELSAAFHNLLHRPNDGLKIFFMVDGVDEYSGDHNVICDLFSTISESQSVKALISSRPIPACVDRFDSYQKLRLQDLTKPDIEIYVSSWLLGNALMQKMDTLESGTTTKLVKTVTAKAQGVFLWVILVVKSIQRSLQRFDTAAELLKEVERIPEGLDKLFDHMFRSMDKRLHLQASKFIQVLLRSIALTPESPISILQLAYVEEPDISAAEEAPIRPLSDEAEALLCERAEGRLRSCCCGLIEVQELDATGDEVRPGMRPVGFIHGTVVEFLESNHSWSFLTQLASQTGFDVDQAILSSSLWELKSMPVGPGTASTRPTTIMQATCRILAFLKAAEIQIGTQISEIRKALAYHWHDDSSFPTPTVELSIYEQSIKRSKTRQYVAMADSNMTELNFFIISCLVQCPDSKFQAALFGALAITDQAAAQYFTYLLTVFLKDLQATPVLVKKSILRLFSRCHEPLLTPFTSPIAAQLGEEGEYESSNFTAWQYLLLHIFVITDQSFGPRRAEIYDSHPQNWILLLDMVKVFIVAAEAPVTTVTGFTVRSTSGRSSEVRIVSVGAMILALLNKVWDTLGGTLQYAEEVAEKARDIDFSLRERAALVSDQQTKIPRPNDPSIIMMKNKIKAANRAFLPRVLVTDDEPKTESSQYIGAAKPSFLTRMLMRRPEHPVVNTDTTIKIPGGAQSRSLLSDLGSLVLGEKSPWNLYLERERARLRPALEGSNRAGTSSQWEYTRKTDRVNLLPPDDQKLVHELVKPGLSKKEERRLFGELRKLTGPKQDRVLECVRVLKSESKGGEAIHVPALGLA